MRDDRHPRRQLGRRSPHPDIVAASAEVADIPADYLVLYQQAAAQFGLDWPVLAAIGRVETNHGRNRNGCAPNSAGARGPMQFLPATFAHAAKLAGLTRSRHLRPGRRDPGRGGLPASRTAPRPTGSAPSTATTRPTGIRRSSCPGPQRYGYGALVVWPLDGRLTQGFGPTDFTAEPARCYEGHCYAHFHDGIDIAAPLGTPVRAIATGRVVLAGRVSDGAVVVEIEHGAGVISLYGHLNPTLSVRDGDSVVAGQVVGLGRADRPHDRAAPPLRDLRLGCADRPAAHPAGAPMTTWMARR